MNDKMIFAAAVVVVAVWLQLIFFHSTWARERRLLRKVERAMGFSLYEWQRDYILRGGKLPDHAPGKTTAFIIRMLLTGTAADILILDSGDVWDISPRDLKENESKEVYCKRYLRQLMRIWEKLYEQDVTVRNLVVRAGS